MLTSFVQFYRQFLFRYFTGVVGFGGLSRQGIPCAPVSLEEKGYLRVALLSARFQTWLL